jgi:hypothetical protein
MSAEQATQTTALVLPDFVLERFGKINSLTNVPIDEIRQEYQAFWMQNEVYLHGTSFVDDEQRHRYCDGVIWARYRSLRPSRDYDVIPIGFDSWKYTKAKHIKRSALYLAVMGSNKQITKKAVPLFENLAELYKTVNIGNRYTVKLTENKDGGLSADRRTVFTNPMAVNLDLLTLYKRLGCLEVPELAKAADTPSRTTKGSTGEFVDSLDWRLVRGIITNYGSGISKYESPWASYTLIDSSLGNDERIDPKTGNVLRAGFSVWLDETLLQYGNDSEVYAIGTISIGKDGQPSMSAINIIPVHAFPIKK